MRKLPDTSTRVRDREGADVKLHSSFDEQEPFLLDFDSHNLLSIFESKANRQNTDQQACDHARLRFYRVSGPCHTHMERARSNLSSARCQIT